MQPHASAGLRSKALEVHAEFTARLHDELGLEPGSRIAALAASLSAPSPPVVSGSVTVPGGRATVDPRVPDLMMRGWQLFTLYTADGMAGARKSYAAAIELDPVHARALSMLGWTHWFDAIGDWSDDAAASLALAGKVRLWQLRHAKALEHLERSLELARGDAYAQFHLADALMWCGRPVESLRRVDQALRLDHNDRGVFQTIRGMALWMSGDPAAARAARGRARTTAQSPLQASVLQPGPALPAAREDGVRSLIFTPPEP